MLSIILWSVYWGGDRFPFLLWISNSDSAHLEGIWQWPKGFFFIVVPFTYIPGHKNATFTVNNLSDGY